MIILLGASASGKTEVVKELVKNYGFHKVVTYTTRKIRPTEINDIDYHFITIEDFLNKKNNGFFFESVNYNGSYYGTAIEDLDEYSVVILEPNGFKSYINSSLKHIVSYFLYCSEDERIRRMRLRGDDEEKIKERIKGDKVAFDVKKIDNLNYILNSNDLSISDISKQIVDLYKTWK